MKFYKILREDMIHHGMHYKEGLNENCEETLYNKECGHGLFFADAKHIMAFVDYGTKIAEVELPEGEKIDWCWRTYKAHRIILKNIRPLWTKETFKQLRKEGVNLHAFEESALRQAAGYGKIDIVKYLIKQQNADIHAMADGAIRYAALNGEFAAVKYLVRAGANYHAKGNDALYNARVNGHEEIVEYLLNLK